MTQTNEQAGMLAVIERVALDPSVDTSKLKDLLDMQMMMNAERAKTDFFQALGQFQSECPRISKTKKGYDNRYQYAPLDEVLQAIKDSLKNCGLTYRWEQREDGDTITVICVVTHINGHSERTELSGEADTSGGKSAIQARASTVQYLRRYTLQGALGIATAESDDDGKSAGAVPYEKIMKHTAAVRELWKTAFTIKQMLEIEDLQHAAEAFAELTNEEKIDLFALAPTKGGIFTTAERATLKSDEFAAELRNFREASA